MLFRTIWKCVAGSRSTVRKKKILDRKIGEEPATTTRNSPSPLCLSLPASLPLSGLLATSRKKGWVGSKVNFLLPPPHNPLHLRQCSCFVQGLPIFFFYFQQIRLPSNLDAGERLERLPKFPNLSS